MVKRRERRAPAALQLNRSGLNSLSSSAFFRVFRVFGGHLVLPLRLAAVNGLPDQPFQLDQELVISRGRLDVFLFDIEDGALGVEHLEIGESPLSETIPRNRQRILRRWQNLFFATRP